VHVTTGLWAENLIRHPSSLPNDNKSAVRDPERIIILLSIGSDKLQTPCSVKAFRFQSHSDGDQLEL
jgi:hypothetical protein